MISGPLLAQLSEWLGVVAITTLAPLSARFRRKPLLFQYPLREGIYVSFLYVSILAVSILFYNRLTVPEGLLPPLTQRLVLAGICVLPFILALAFRRQPLLSAGLGKSNFKLSLSLLVALVFLAVFLRGKIYSLLHGVSLEQADVLLLWLGISALEESIFRGYIQSRLSSWLGAIPGWLVCSLLFAIWQIPRLMLNPTTLFFNLGFALAQGLVLGWIFLKSGHVVAPAVYRAVSEWISILN